jgi:hypothetical protein
VVGGHEREMSGGQPLAAYLGEGEREREERKWGRGLAGGRNQEAVGTVRASRLRAA